MQIIETKEALDKFIVHRKDIALVATMGNLHDGHFALVKHAATLAQDVVVSIYVNPLQFGILEDFARYPRTLEKDIEALSSLGIAAVFIPQDSVIYSHSSAMAIEPPPLAKTLCGITRPNFFSGIVSVVLRLFNLIRPRFAIFGEKDYQQYLVIKNMVQEFKLPIEVVPVPIVRQANGLALSSRNQYLSESEHLIAQKLYETLIRLAKALEIGEAFSSLKQKAWRNLAELGFQIDYLALRDAATLRSANTLNVNRVNSHRLLIAATLGVTRLIDNVPVSL